MESPFNIVRPQKTKVPILVSVPHAGLEFPDNIIGHYKNNLAKRPDDTDFFVHDLYGFVSDLGITMIQANYSRWVIDLNRSPEDINLYNDGRLITGLTPTTNFLGESIYVSKKMEPSPEEIIRRKDQYYFPYHNAIEKILDAFVKEFGVAILWDAHSIRRTVKSIHPKPFPDLILGTNEGHSADSILIDIVRDSLSNSPFEFSYNNPFKGGYITRYFGRPKQKRHALQLEMTKDLYMDGDEEQYDSEKAKSIQAILMSTFELIIKQISASHN